MQAAQCAPLTLRRTEAAAPGSAAMSQTRCQLCWPSRPAQAAGRAAGGMAKAGEAQQAAAGGSWAAGAASPLLPASCWASASSRLPARSFQVTVPSAGGGSASGSGEGGGGGQKLACGASMPQLQLPPTSSSPLQLTRAHPGPRPGCPWGGGAGGWPGRPGGPPRCPQGRARGCRGPWTQQLLPCRPWGCPGRTGRRPLVAAQAEGRLPECREGWGWGRREERAAQNHMRPPGGGRHVSARRRPHVRCPRRPPAPPSGMCLQASER